MTFRIFLTIVVFTAIQPTMVQGQQKNNLTKTDTANISNTGIPRRTPVNRRLFHGIKLSQFQIDSIVKLAEYYQTRRSRLSESHQTIDSTQAYAMIPEIKREQQSYRTILDNSQRIIFDKNSKSILQLWLSAIASRQRTK